MSTKKGFTLLELLIVIGILAILSTTIVLVINPAELLRKARDSQRISDLNTVKTAIAYYITEAADPNIGEANKTYSDVSGAVTCFGASQGAGNGVFTTDGSGWIPIDFDSELTGGSPIGSLPRDPAQTLFGDTDGLYYVYGVASATDLTFKLVARMESTYYSTGSSNVQNVDGGTEDALYEIGTDMTLTISTSSACYNLQ